LLDDGRWHTGVLSILVIEYSLVCARDDDSDDRISR
jgi:hypothetical protein